MPSKTPTPQAVSRLLSKAGFKRSASRSNRLRGYSSRSAGFVVFDRQPGEVGVYHESGFFAVDDAIRARSAAQEGKYADALEEAGYAVERGEGGMSSPVIVRALPDSEPAETKEG